MNNNPQAVVAVKEELIDEVRLKKKTAVVATEQGLVCTDNTENFLKALI